MFQRLNIGIGDKELHAPEARRDHAVNGVGAAAADTDHFDAGTRSQSFFKQKSDVCFRHVCRHCCSFFCHGSLAH